VAADYYSAMNHVERQLALPEDRLDEIYMWYPKIWVDAAVVRKVIDSLLMFSSIFRELLLDIIH